MNVQPAGVDPMVPAAVRLVETRRELDDTVSLVRENVNPVLGRFQPGQFEMLYVFGVGEVPISISGDPGEEESTQYTIRSVGGVTRRLCGMESGRTIGVRGPYGIGWPMDEATGRDVLIVAGGIGLAPIRPVVYGILAHRERYGRVNLLYGAKNPDQVLYRNQLEAWEEEGEIEVRLTVDHSTADWQRNVGVVTDLIPGVRLNPEETLAMVCGPEIMMRFTVMALHKQGLPDPRINISIERNMHCGVGLCGRCQIGPWFVCVDGPVFRYDRIKRWFETRGI